MQPNSHIPLPIETSFQRAKSSAFKKRGVVAHPPPFTVHFIVLNLHNHRSLTPPLNIFTVASLREKSLRATALVHHHLGHVPLDDGVVRSEVDQAHAGELEGGAAGLHAAQVVGLPELVYHVRVVRDEGVGRPVVAAVAPAVVRVVPANAKR